MVNKQRHRGADPEDKESFGEGMHVALQSSVRDLSWLLTRGYAVNSALKIVGDRYRLTARQRNAVGRCSCLDASRDRRLEKEVAADKLRGGVLRIDGFNVLTTLEAAFSGGILLPGREGCYRDIASMHGNYRVLDETVPVLQVLQAELVALDLAKVGWYFDRSVSNSGRLKAILAEIGDASDGPSTEIELVPDPDPILAQSLEIVATADSSILDACDQWFNLARYVVERRISEAWVIPMQNLKSG